MTETTRGKSDHAAAVTQICECIQASQRFLITSHARPDGDSIGSQVAMAYAFAISARMCDWSICDPAPPHFHVFPGVADIEISIGSTTRGRTPYS